MTVTCYDVLGVSRNATKEQIVEAHKKLAKKYHPDLMAGKSIKEKEKSGEIMKQINAAKDEALARLTNPFTNSQNYDFTANPQRRYEQQSSQSSQQRPNQGTNQSNDPWKGWEWDVDDMRRKETEKKAREQREREQRERERQEAEKKNREQYAKQQREQQEAERKAREQREREQREAERRTREQQEAEEKAREKKNEEKIKALKFLKSVVKVFEAYNSSASPFEMIEWILKKYPDMEPYIDEIFGNPFDSKEAPESDEEPIEKPKVKTKYR